MAAPALFWMPERVMALGRLWLPAPRGFSSAALGTAAAATLAVAVMAAVAGGPRRLMAISIAALLGIWYLGTPIMMFDAHFAEHGFGDTGDLIIMASLALLYPLITWLMSVYDGRLPALLLVTLALMLTAALARRRPWPSESVVAGPAAQGRRLAPALKSSARREAVAPLPRQALRRWRVEMEQQAGLVHLKLHEDEPPVAHATHPRVQRRRIERVPRDPRPAHDRRRARSGAALTGGGRRRAAWEKAPSRRPLPAPEVAPVTPPRRVGRGGRAGRARHDRARRSGDRPVPRALSTLKRRTTGASAYGRSAGADLRPGGAGGGRRRQQGHGILETIEEAAARRRRSWGASGRSGGGRSAAAGRIGYVMKHNVFVHRCGVSTVSLRVFERV
ncbi:MAG: hypothetical protein U0531_14140 [Dehalococcoidia bacterium]